MAKKILIITDDAGESLEIYYARHRFLEAGWTPVIAATKTKLLHGVTHDFEPGWSTYVERPGYLVQADLALKDVRVKDYAAVLLIGGRAPEFLRHVKEVIRIVRRFDEQKKGLFAICHGIQILVAAGLVKGRRVTCYCNVRGEAELAGAKWIDRESVVDGRLITAQTWESHPEFYRDILKFLDGNRRR